MDLVIITPDGVGIRNFVVTFLKQFQGRATVLHELPGKLLDRVRNGLTQPLDAEPLLAPKERPLPFTLRQTLSYAHVFWADTSAMRYTRERKLGGSWRTVAANRTAKFIGKMASTSTGVRGVERAYFAAMGQSPELDYFTKLFQQRRPDIVLSSSQQSPRVLLPVLAAKSLGIPTVAFVASWDNLTSKGRIAAPFDHYLVWSEHMKRELLQFYPHVQPSSVHVTGTPQFDCYRDESLKMERSEFFARIGADPQRPLICYSGGDTGNCPEDPEHLRILLDGIRTQRIPGNPQVIVRPSPADPGDRYAQLRRDYPELIYSAPAWEHLEPGNWTRCIPMPEDLKLLANLTRYADLNVNMASTMTLDFAIQGKPVVNIAFDVNSPPPLRVPLWDLFYQWEHYRPVVEMKAARFARSADELLEHVNSYLNNPSLDEEGRRRLVELQVGVPVGHACSRITQSLDEILAEGNRDMPAQTVGAAG